jgi:hypothetical protein
MKFYDPIVLGAGITIEQKPSLPNHAIRLQDVQNLAYMQRVAFTSMTSISLAKRAGQICIVQIFDQTNSAIIPDTLTQDPNSTSIEITFAQPQSGYLLVFSVGEI